MKLAFLLWLSSVLPQPIADPLCLTTTIYLESRNQSVLGQRAVAEVAMRRLNDGNWGAMFAKSSPPQTICAHTYQTGFRTQ